MTWMLNSQSASLRMFPVVSVAAVQADTGPCKSQVQNLFVDVGVDAAAAVLHVVDGGGAGLQVPHRMKSNCHDHFLRPQQ